MSFWQENASASAQPQGHLRGAVLAAHLPNTNN